MSGIAQKITQIGGNLRKRSSSRAPLTCDDNLQHPGTAGSKKSAGSMKKIKTTKTELTPVAPVPAVEDPGEKPLESNEAFFTSREPVEQSDSQNLKIQYLEREIAQLNSQNEHLQKLSVAQKGQIKSYQVKIADKLQNIDPDDQKEEEKKLYLQKA